MPFSVKTDSGFDQQLSPENTCLLHHRSFTQMGRKHHCYRIDQKGTFSGQIRITFSNAQSPETKQLKVEQESGRRSWFWIISNSKQNLNNMHKKALLVYKKRNPCFFLTAAGHCYIWDHTKALVFVPCLITESWPNPEKHQHATTYTSRERDSAFGAEAHLPVGAKWVPVQ